MIIPYSKIIGAAVVDLTTQHQMGIVSDVVIKKSSFSLYGLMVKTAPLSFKIKTLSAEDIVQITEKTIIIGNESVLLEAKETIRISDAYKDGYFGIGQLVVTKSGNKLGRVYDYLVSTPGLTITKFYVKSLFSERIIATTAIIKFEKNKITIEDDFDIASLIKAPQAKAAC